MAKFDILHDGHTTYRIGFKCEMCSSYNRQSVKKGYVDINKPHLLICDFCGHLSYIGEQNIKEAKEKMKRTAEKGIEIVEGRHEGVIMAIEERKKPFAYIDVVVSVDEEKKNDGTPLTLKVGFPDFMSTNSQLGLFVGKVLGIEIVDDETYDFDELLNKRISYVTYNEESENGKYARIQKTTIQPIKSPQPQKRKA